MTSELKDGDPVLVKTRSGNLLPAIFRGHGDRGVSCYVQIEGHPLWHIVPTDKVSVAKISEGSA